MDCRCRLPHHGVLRCSLLLPTADPIEQASRIGALDASALLALISLVSLGALLFVFRLYVKKGEALEALHEKHRVELADINEKRLALATEFEGTIRGLLMVMKPARRTPGEKP